MTAPDVPTADLYLLFRAALPAWAAEHLTPQGVADAHTALGNGHDPAALAEHVTFHVRGLANAGQTLRHRLHRAAHPEEEQCER